MNFLTSAGNKLSPDLLCGKPTEVWVRQQGMHPDLERALRFRWVAVLLSTAPLAGLLDKIYGIFLMLRPCLLAMASHGALRR